MWAEACVILEFFPHPEPQFLYLVPYRPPWEREPVWRESRLSRSLDVEKGGRGPGRLAEASER